MDMTYWCESCARKNNCYTIRSRPKCFTPITSNDRTADRKTEPLDKDINVRSKTEPQTCETCKFADKEWYEEPCDRCGYMDKYEPKTEPQAEREGE